MNNGKDYNYPRQGGMAYEAPSAKKLQQYFGPVM